MAFLLGDECRLASSDSRPGLGATLASLVKGVGGSDATSVHAIYWLTFHHLLIGLSVHFRNFAVFAHIVNFELSLRLSCKMK